MRDAVRFRFTAGIGVRTDSGAILRRGARRDDAASIGATIEVTVLRRPFLFVCLLLLSAIDASTAQAVVRQDSTGNARSNRSGTWAATTSGGLTLVGTWTAVLDSAHGTVTGTWTLVGAQGATVANGGWSAAKSPTRWTGAWRAVIAGRDGEFSGTWASGVDLQASAQFVDLFEKAVQSAVNGTWRSGSRSGAWSIRSIKSTSPPGDDASAGERAQHADVQRSALATRFWMFRRFAPGLRRSPP